MRSLSAIALAAALSLPGLVSAQAIHSGLHLVAAAEAPAFAFQASAVKAAAPRVFTGIIAPIRLTEVQLAPLAAAAKGEVTVQYIVSPTGVPEDVQVVKGLDGNTDQRVVDAVRRVRYTPGKLNGQAVAIPVTLHVGINQ